MKEKLNSETGVSAEIPRIFEKKFPHQALLSQMRHLFRVI